MIVNTKHITQILELEKELKGGLSRNNYIRKCYKIINKNIVNYFAKSKYYLLHKVYFSNESNGITPLNFSDVSKLQNQISKTQIQYAEKMANLKGNKPLSSIILEKHIQGLVLYNGETPDCFDTIKGQNLAASNYIENFAKKLGVEDTRDIEFILREHKKHSDEFEGQFYAYFIRPFATHKFYNGVFLIMLKRPLTESEFIELGNLWTKILSETTIINFETIGRNKEQELIFEEQTHTWNSVVISIFQHLDIVHGRITKKPVDLSNDTKDHANYALEKVKQLNLITAFNLFLMKTKDVSTWDNMNEMRNLFFDGHLAESLKPQKIILSEILLKVIKTLEMHVSSLKYVNLESTSNQLRALESLSQTIRKFPPFKIVAIEMGMFIIFLDLLKNALFHSDWKKIKLNITVADQDKYIEISINNNKRLPQDVHHFINEEKISDSFLSKKGGLRTIKRIFKSHLFLDNNKFWAIRSLPYSLANKGTAIILNIPKSK